MVNLAELNPEWVKHTQEVIANTDGWADFVAQMMLDTLFTEYANFSFGAGFFLGYELQYQLDVVGTLLKYELTADFPSMQAVYKEVHPDDANIAQSVDEITPPGLLAITTAYAERLANYTKQQNERRLAGHLERAHQEIQ